MKHFKLMKGVLVCLLSLVLVVTCFTTVGAKAEEAKPTNYTVTLDPGLGTGEAKTVSVDVAEDTTEYTLPTTFPTGWEAPEKKVFDGWSTKKDGSKIAEEKITLTADTTIYAFYKAAPKVTFTVKVECSDENIAGDYTYVAEELYTANSTITLADILEAAKKSDKTLEDATAWIYNSSTGKGCTLAGDTNLSFTAGTFKATKALTKDEAVTVYVAPAKLNVSFTVTDDGKNYKSTFSVENGAKTKSKISYADIAAGLKAIVDDEEIALEGKVVTKVGDVAQTGKYSASAYEVANNTIGTADFEDVTIEVVDAFTENTGYDPETDSIFFESPVEATVYWADVKKAAGGQYASKAFKSFDLAKKTVDGNTTYTGSISLNDKATGVKIGVSKTAYIYASIIAPEEGKAAYKPNFIVEATPYKKIAVTLAFAQADAKAGECAIAAVTTTDLNKKTVVYSGTYDEEKNAENYLYGVGKVKDDSDAIRLLQYSTDGTTWYDIMADSETVNGKEVKRAFDLDKLYELVNGGSKSTLYFRLKGEKAKDAKPDDPKTEDVDESVAAKNAYRPTLTVKVGVNAAKDAKAVKVNVSNGTIALKNGYDYFVTNDKKATPTVDEAITILPFNKEGKATDTIDGVETAISTIPTSDFIPTKKVADNNKMFTSIKVKSVLISDLDDVDISKEMYIWVRKSASTAKPAEKWVLITIAGVTDGPAVTTVKGKNYYSVQDVADTKGVIAAPEVTNAKTDKNSGAFEYLVVDAADYAESKLKVDLSTAKWSTLKDKGLIVGKSKSKYSTEAGKKATDHVLKEGSIILIRRAGDKKANILASDYTMTTIVKEEVDVEVEKDGKKATEKKSLYVWKQYVPTT